MNIDNKDIFENQSEEVKNFIHRLINECNKHSIDTYLVGGYLRDYILDIYSNDIDLVFVGDTSKILHYIDLNFTKYDYSKSFKTIKVMVDSQEIDLISARKEVYSLPGSLPEITLSNILDDLNRRDFTINSMALKINNPALTPVIDFNLSQSDIDNKLIRVHHKQSFSDDPTRIFRAFRYASRFSFDIESNTSELIYEEIERRKLSSISHIRIINELKKDFKEKNYKSIIDFYKKYALYDIMFSDTFSRTYLENVQSKFYLSKFNHVSYNDIDLYKSSEHILTEEELIKLLLLVCIRLAEEDKYLLYSQNISKKIKTLVVKISDVLFSIYKLDNYKLYKTLDKLSLEERHILLYFIDDIIFVESIKTHTLGRMSKPSILADDILSMGIDKNKIALILDKVHIYKFERGVTRSSGIPLDELPENGRLSNKDDLIYLKIIVEKEQNHYTNKVGSR